MGDLRDDLVVVAADKARGFVRALHVEGFFGFFGAEQAGDGATALVILANGGQKFWIGRFRQGAAHQLDGVAGLDGLRLFAVPEGFDGHAGARLHL